MNVLLQVPKYFGLLQIFWSRPKIDIHFMPAQKFLKRHKMHMLNIWTGTKHFGTCRRKRQKFYLGEKSFFVHFSRDSSANNASSSFRYYFTPLWAEIFSNYLMIQFLWNLWKLMFHKPWLVSKTYLNHTFGLKISEC